MGEGGRAFRILKGTPKEGDLQEGPRRRWKENIGMYLKEMVTIMRNLVDSAPDRD